MASNPKAAPFVSGPLPAKCILCIDTEVKQWLHDCLVATRKAENKRPGAAFIHREAKRAFADRVPAHENSTRRHLRDHEPAYYEWVNGKT